MLPKLVEIAFKNITHKPNRFVVVILTWNMQQYATLSLLPG